MIRLLMVEDSPVSAALLAHIFESDPEVKVVGVVSTAQEALEFVRNHAPDVVSMDINLPDMDGFEATRRIMEIRPMPVVVVTATVPKEDVYGYFRAID
jgi:two-component system, chemotaxis family, protein-glutamate methylesterase/glutaminase